MRPIWTTLLIALLLAVAPAAFASTTWYVNGVTGGDSNDCKSPTTACKTIGHAVSLAASGDSVPIAAATYTENLTIAVSLKILGAGAATTIIDGEGVGSVVTISKSVRATLSNVTIQNGLGSLSGGGIENSGSLILDNSSVSGNIGFAGGGGINNTGFLTINKSTIAGNTEKGIRNFPVYGGGIYNRGTLIVNNSR